MMGRSFMMGQKMSVCHLHVEEFVPLRVLSGSFVRGNGKSLRISQNHVNSSFFYSSEN